VNGFLEELSIQRWDDHRYYHQSRINQTLHLVSAISFLVAYALLFVDPAWAAIVAWCVSMVTRQAGHFFFEPRGFDQVNQVTDEYKEDVKVGYNIRRKVVLMAAWAAVPALLGLSPGLLGLIQPAHGFVGYAHDVGMAWFFLGVTGLLFRVLQLTWQGSLAKGLTWATKIITDPFHDIALYYKAPIHLLRGQLLDPMEHVRQH
jgi:hypothetical protein